MNLSAARYIWSDEQGRGRNRYVLFRRPFDLPDYPLSADLWLFADTRYRLLVNGETLGHGPARFKLAAPEADQWDLTPHLRPGRNVLAVMVCSYGQGTFLSDPSRGGLIAALTLLVDNAPPQVIVTDESWRALPSTGHNPAATQLSFAVGPGEWLDARRLPVGWDQPEFDDTAWPTATPLADQAHWGPLTPRSIPLLDERAIVPRHLVGAWRTDLLPGYDVYGLATAFESQTGVAAAVFTVDSPRAQMIELTGSWGRWAVNGEALTLHSLPGHDWCGRGPVELRAGLNLIAGAERLTGDGWELALGLPRNAGLTVGAAGELARLVGPVAEETESLARRLAAGEQVLPARPVAPGEARLSPFAARAWSALTTLPTPAGLPLAGARLDATDGLTLLFDVGEEYLGRLQVELTAAAGTRLDVVYTERVAAGRAVVMTQAQRLAEGYVCRAGRQTWHAFHPRGGRYLELTIRGDLTRFELHRVALTRALYPVRPIGRFACSDPLLNDIWTLGQRTQAACLEDAFLDCPWRERGLYAGDLLVQYAVNLAAFGDHALMRRCLRLLFATRDASGFLAPCSHGLPTGRHPDYTAIPILALGEYYDRTGDRALVAELAEQLPPILDALAGLATTDSPLLDATGTHPYIDLSRTEREGVNCAVNAFYQRACAEAARMFRLLGRDATALAARATELREAISTAFWSEERGVFLDRRPSDVEAPEPSVPGNVLPVLFDLATPRQAERAVAWLLTAIAPNQRVPEPQRLDDFACSPYFSHYLLEVLYRHGHAIAAEAYIRREWGRMLTAGAWTCWEFFLPRASLCHAWAACPTHYLSAKVLGVTFPEPGRPDKVLLAPQPGTLTWAEGVYPHPRGPIEVSWRLVGQQLELDCVAPEGVEIATVDDV